MEYYKGLENGAAKRKRTMDEIVSKIKQLFCRHKWEFTNLTLNPFPFAYVKLYVCSKCGKIKWE